MIGGRIWSSAGYQPTIGVADHEEIAECAARQDRARQVSRGRGARARGSSGAAICGAVLNSAPNARSDPAAETPLDEVECEVLTGRTRFDNLDRVSAPARRLVQRAGAWHNALLQAAVPERASHANMNGLLLHFNDVAPYRLLSLLTLRR